MTETLKVGVCERCSRRVFLECPAGDETGELRAKVCARCTREQKHGPLMAEKRFADALRQVLDVSLAPVDRRAAAANVATAYGRALARAEERDEWQGAQVVLAWLAPDQVAT